MYGYITSQWLKSSSVLPDTLGQNIKGVTREEQRDSTEKLK